MIDELKKLIVDFECEFSNDSTVSEKGVRSEDYNELAEEIVKLFYTTNVSKDRELLLDFAYWEVQEPEYMEDVGFIVESYLLEKSNNRG